MQVRKEKKLPFFVFTAKNNNNKWDLCQVLFKKKEQFTKSSK